MKIILKILKWIGLSIGSLLALILLSGLAFRLFGPKPQPPGELVDVDGVKLHINSTGEKNNQPTVVIEAGQGVPSEHFHWLSEGLKDSLRVVRYDRAGIGYSELTDAPRDPKTVAKELHKLLEKAGEAPPYIMVGHSFGGLFIRVFADLYPDEVDALVFVDSSHPDQRERLKMSAPKDVSGILNAAAVAADMGLVALLDRINGHMLHVKDFPDEVNDRFYDYTINGRYIRGVKDEVQWDSTAYAQARATKDFGSLPIRVFTANKKYSGAAASDGWLELQAELAELSSNGQHILVDGHHNSIYTKKENADLICHEILQMLNVLPTANQSTHNEYTSYK